MKLKIWIVVIFTFTLIEHECYSSRILGLFPVQVSSHFMMYKAVMKTLAERGHYVDVISHHPSEETIPRYRDYSIQGTLPNLTNSLPLDFIQSNNHTLLENMWVISNMVGYDLCELIFNSTAFRTISQSKNDQQYDIIITEALANDCLLILSQQLHGVPIMAITTSSVLPWTADYFGIPDNPSYIPNYFATNSFLRMTFFERISNAMILFISKLVHYYIFIPKTDKLIQRLFGDGYPSVYDLSRNVTLLLINTHISVSDPRPYPPNVIEIAGIHISVNNTRLPKDIKKILDNSKNGVIYFSFGSVIQIESFPSNVLRGLIEAFAQFPHITVLWKIDSKILSSPLPANIVVRSWFPQQEILCHKNVKLFITHSGMMGTQESIYCGVPMIGVPFYGDQYQNIQNCVENNIAIKLSYGEITKDNFISTIRTILEDKTYQENIQRLSKRFKDRPMSPFDTVTYWVEYSIRHKGAHHLKPASVHLYWYQYYLLDVIVCITIIPTVLIFIIVFKIITMKCKTRTVSEKSEITTKLIK